MTYTNSPLVEYIKLSPNYTATRKGDGKIRVITIHCVVGQVTIQRLGEIFANPNREASSNYGVDKDGKIGMFVEEKHRSWCSGGRDSKGNIIRVNEISGADNDHQAITIEVASDTTAPYAITNKAYESLIRLVADIAYRNPDIGELKWVGDKTLVGDYQRQNMTVHRWFANKSCPGDYIYNRLSDIAGRANILLNQMKSNDNEVDSNVETTTKEVSVNYEDVNVGDILKFNGTLNYVSANAKNGVPTGKSLCKITGKTSASSKHPVHARAVNSNGKYISGVYGWVNLEDLSKVVVVEKEKLPENCRCNECPNKASCSILASID